MAPAGSRDDRDPERLIDPRTRTDDESELSIRPRRLDEMIGQLRVKENLKIAIQAARSRGETLDHVLLYGPPGLGKTTLSNIIANEMDAPIRITSGPALEKPRDLAAILSGLEPQSVFFIDEIHRLNRTVEEILYSAMEDFRMDIVIGQGPAARTVALPVPRFTLVGATTRAGMVSSPMRDRFGIQHGLQLYDVDDLNTIVRRSAAILDVHVDDGGSLEIARRSRGTPRVANRLLRRVRDWAQVRGTGTIDRKAAETALWMLEVDELGLDAFDRRFLTAIIQKFDGGPVGLETLAAMLGEERDTIEDMAEPYLMQLGFLNRTSRGRAVTRQACAHVGLPLPMSLQQGAAQYKLMDDLT